MEKPILPLSPTYIEKYLYVKSNKFQMYFFGLLSTLLVVSGGAIFSLHKSEFLWFLGFLIVTSIYLGISYFIGIFSKRFSVEKHNDLVRKWKHIQPTVDVYLPCCGEPIEIIANTHFYVSRLDWPKDKLRIYVLDDGASDAVKKSADDYGFTYIRRPNRGELKKAGNIRYAFKQTDGEFIVILDADFCPRPDFISEIIGYFYEEPRTAIVQTPQFFSSSVTMTKVERGAASIQELFYRLIQVNRDTWGGSICVGSCAMYRRKALEPYGGTYPIQHSEDVHTGFNCIKDGWVLKYVPIIISKGRCPDTLGAFFVQQYRWCMGSTSLLFNRQLFWNSKLSLMTRVCYLSGMLYYVATAIGLFFTPLPGMLVVWFSPEHVVWYSMAFSAPSFLFGIFFMMYWNNEPYGIYSIKARFISYYAHAFALYDKLRSGVMEWIPTGNMQAVKANKRVKKFKRLLFAWPVLCVICVYLGAYVNMESIYDYDFYPVILFSTFYTWLQLSILWSSWLEEQ